MNKDIIQTYKSKKILSNLGLVALSFVLALGINFTINNTQIGSSLKTNLQEAKKDANINSDLYTVLEKNGSNRTIHIKAGKDMNQVKNVSMSFFYNSNIVIKDIVPDIENMSLLKLVDTEGSKTISVSLDSAKNIKAGDSIATIFLEKNTNKLENLNIINSNFTDDKNKIYYLTTSGVEF